MFERDDTVVTWIISHLINVNFDVAELDLFRYEIVSKPEDLRAAHLFSIMGGLLFIKLQYFRVPTNVHC